MQQAHETPLTGGGSEGIPTSEEPQTRPTDAPPPFPTRSSPTATPSDTTGAPLSPLGTAVDIPKLLRDGPPEYTWAVKGMLAEGDLAAISGQGGIGKSYGLIRMAIDLSHGRPLFGKFAVTRPYSIVYLDLEMPGWATYNRFGRMLIGNDITETTLSPNLRVFTKGSIMLDRPDHTQQLHKLVVEHKVDFIMIDSVRRVVAGDENDSGTTSRLLRTIKPFRDALGCGFIFIAHWRKHREDPSLNAPTEMLRGSSDWRNMLDCHIAMTPHKDEDHILVYPDKSRHAAEVGDNYTIKFDHFNREDDNGPFKLMWVENPFIVPIRVAVIGAISANPGITVPELVEVTKNKDRYVRYMLKELLEMKQVRVEKAVNTKFGKHKYYLVDDKK